MTAASRALGAIALAFAAASAHAEVTLQSAWLRPAYAGQPQAQLYVDILSTEPLKLVGARSPVAADAKLVQVDDGDPDPTRHEVVVAMPVPANAATRLAYLGSHVRLIDIREDLAPGGRVRFELEFTDAKGKRHTVAAEALVRGLMPRRPPDAEAATPASR